MTLSEPLQQLAALAGLQTEYFTIDGVRHEAEPDILVRMARRLGFDLAGPDDAARAVAVAQAANRRRLLEPVLVVWDGQAITCTLNLPERLAAETVACTLKEESGRLHDWRLRPLTLPREGAWSVPGEAGGTETIVGYKLSLPAGLPAGYHTFEVAVGKVRGQATIVSAPSHTWQGEPGAATVRRWGLFAPLYALRSATSQGIGDLTDLDRLREWTAARGGQVVATLPLLGAFLGEVPFEYSPYTPSSRLAWNEVFLDLNAVPELATTPGARALMQGSAWQRTTTALNALPHTDYAGAMKQKRAVLDLLSAALHAAPAGSPRRTAYDAFVAAHPVVTDYAAFRAVCEKRREPWCNWPERLREGTLLPGDYDEKVAACHRFMQFETDRQLRHVATRAREAGVALYVDQPLGVHPDSYDLWRERRLYVMGVSCGAPPDPLATTGQDWGMPPLNPVTIRETGYRYAIDSLRHLMRVAGVLRIDHVMGLHRIFTILSGEKGTRGVYLRYQPQEWWAIVCIESHRHRCTIVGEDLGTVPDEVRDALVRHAAAGMSVAQFELWNDADRALRPVPATRVASLNTHDTPTWAGFVAGADIDLRVELGWLPADQAPREKEVRGWHFGALAEFLRRQQRMAGEGTPGKLLRGCLEYLAASPTRLLLLTLEDLWLEVQPQNVPGTWREKPNWQRRAAHTLEKLTSLPGVAETLAAVDQLRKASAQE